MAIGHAQVVETGYEGDEQQEIVVVLPLGLVAAAVYGYAHRKEDEEEHCSEEGNVFLSIGSHCLGNYAVLDEIDATFSNVGYASRHQSFL